MAAASPRRPPSLRPQRRWRPALAKPSMLTPLLLVASLLPHIPLAGGKLLHSLSRHAIASASVGSGAGGTAGAGKEIARAVGAVSRQPSPGVNSTGVLEKSVVDHAAGRAALSPAPGDLMTAPASPGITHSRVLGVASAMPAASGPQTSDHAPVSLPVDDELPCQYIFGISKWKWAVLCDILALALVLLCIPLLLTCSRRRPPGAPLFDCSFGGDKADLGFQASTRM